MQVSQHQLSFLLFVWSKTCNTNYKYKEKEYFCQDGLINWTDDRDLSTLTVLISMITVYAVLPDGWSRWLILALHRRTHGVTTTLASSWRCAFLLLSTFLYGSCNPIVFKNFCSINEDLPPLNARKSKSFPRVGIDSSRSQAGFQVDCKALLWVPCWSSEENTNLGILWSGMQTGWPARRSLACRLIASMSVSVRPQRSTEHLSVWNFVLPVDLGCTTQLAQMKAV